MKFSVIFSNIIGFDGLIFILAAVNAVIFISAKRSVNRLYSSMHRQVYAPCADEDMSEIDRDISGLSVQKVSRMREQAESRYTLYVNITGLFPLLGILGTVISLLGMVGSSDSVTNGFFAALTSTFWGLVAAIGFKFSDGFISSRLDDSARAAELYISRAMEETRRSGKRPSGAPHKEKTAGSSGDMRESDRSYGHSPDENGQQDLHRGKNKRGKNFSRGKNVPGANVSREQGTENVNVFSEKNKGSGNVRPGTDEPGENVTVGNMSARPEGSGKNIPPPKRDDDRNISKKLGGGDKNISRASNASNDSPDSRQEILP